MKLEIHMSVEITPEELKGFIKAAKKLGCNELVQQAITAATVQATPSPVAEPELPVGTFVGGEEVPVQESTPPASKRGKKPKATLGFR